MDGVWGSPVVFSRSLINGSFLPLSQVNAEVEVIDGEGNRFTNKTGGAQYLTDYELGYSIEKICLWEPVSRVFITG